MKIQPSPYCALCGQSKTLRNSHIVPHFVFDRMKKTAGTEYIRFSHAPNLREQDGTKVYLLCEDCEQLFSGWENSFSREIFVPLHDGQASSFRYESWFVLFSTSILWRVLLYFKLTGALNPLPGNLRASIDVVLDTWRDFLLNKRKDPGAFKPHCLLLGDVTSTNDPSMPTNINRYIALSSDGNLGYADNYAFVYVKMLRVVLVGFIDIPNPQEWTNTEISLQSGTIEVDKCSVPREVIEFIKKCAAGLRESQKNLSARQREKIENELNKHLGRALSSEMDRAMQLDIQVFGDAAVKDEL